MSSEKRRLHVDKELVIHTLLFCWPRGNAQSNRPSDAHKKSTSTVHTLQDAVVETVEKHDMQCSTPGIFLRGILDTAAPAEGRSALNRAEIWTLRWSSSHQNLGAPTWWNREATRTMHARRPR